MDILKKAEEIEKAAEEMILPKDDGEKEGVLKKLIDETGDAADAMLELKHGTESGPGKLDQMIQEVEDAAETLLDLDR